MALTFLLWYFIFLSNLSREPLAEANPWRPNQEEDRGGFCTYLSFKTKLRLNLVLPSVGIPNFSSFHSPGGLKDAKESFLRRMDT